MFMAVKGGRNNRMTVENRDEAGYIGRDAGRIINGSAGTVITNAIEWPMPVNESMLQLRMVGLRLGQYLVNPGNLSGRDVADISVNIHADNAGVLIIKSISQKSSVCGHSRVVGNSRKWRSIGLNEVILPVCWIRVMVIMVASDQESLVEHAVTSRASTVTI